ncbi:hypothetical protein GGU11DRAFT_742899 [Lentinula aff. detonsa]|nr:hypothetical protein GGU11DRAFT_742899 [Lentinula aff. detonsa]
MVHSRSVITAVFAVGAASSAIAIPLPSSGVAAGGSTRITSNVLVTPDSTGPPAPASTVTVKPSGNDPFAGAGIDTQKLNSRELDIIVGYENEPFRHMGKHHHHVHVHDEEKEMKMEVEEHYHHDYHNHGEEEVGVEVKETHSHYHPHHHYAGEELEIEVKGHHRHQHHRHCERFEECNHHHHGSEEEFDVAPEEHHRHSGEELNIDIKEFSSHHHRHHKYPGHHVEHENDAEIIAAPVSETKAEKVMLVLDMLEQAGVHSRAHQMERRHAKGSSPPNEPVSGDSTSIKQSPGSFVPPSTGKSLSPIREESSPEPAPKSEGGKRPALTKQPPFVPGSSSSGSNLASRSTPYHDFGGNLD